jgi:hypothetical protein
MLFQRTLPGAKDVVPVAPNDSTDEFPAVTKTADDLFDRHIVIRQREDRRVDLLSAPVAFILQTLGGGEQIGIDSRRADGGSDLAHHFASASRKARLAFSIRCQ